MSYRKKYFLDNKNSGSSSISIYTSIVVENSKGMMLLCRDVDKDIWTLPSGILKNGYAIEDSVKSIIKEDFGLEVTINRVIGTYSKSSNIIDFSDGMVVHNLFIGFHCYFKDEVDFENNSHIRFFNEAEIEDLNIEKFDKTIIKDCMSNTRPVVR